MEMATIRYGGRIVAISAPAVLNGERGGGSDQNMVMRDVQKKNSTHVLD